MSPSKSFIYKITNKRRDLRNIMTGITPRCTCGSISRCNSLTRPLLVNSGSKLRLPLQSAGRRGEASQSRRACVLVSASSVPGSEEHIIRTAESLLNIAASSTGPSQLDHLAARATSLLYTLADAASVSPSAATAVADTAQSSNKNGGFFGPLASLFESILKVLESGLDRVGVPYAYGFAIILLTLLVKAATFPLTQKQVQSTVAMQALQPRIKEIQNRYKGKDQQEMQVQVAQLYKEAGVNPLAGCLPTLATLPVWIGLYRALSNVADEGLLTAGFFWIPSLAGPTSLAAQKAGAGSWLFPFKDGQPPLGWSETISYLILPVLLIVSQFISQKIMTPQTDDPQQQQTQKYLQFLPLLIGYFSLNVPSGLTLYWFVNNLLSTAQQVYLKSSTSLPESVTKPAASSSLVSGSGGTIVKPDKQAAKAQRKQPPTEMAIQSKGSTQQQQARSRQGEKFRALKAKEAAKKAARLGAQAAASATGNPAESAGAGMDVALESNASPVQTKDRDDEPKVPHAPPAKDNRTKGNGSQH